MKFFKEQNMHIFAKRLAIFVVACLSIALIVVISVSLASFFAEEGVFKTQPEPLADEAQRELTEDEYKSFVTAAVTGIKRLNGPLFQLGERQVNPDTQAAEEVTLYVDGTRYMLERPGGSLLYFSRENALYFKYDRSSEGGRYERKRSDANEFEKTTRIPLYTALAESLRDCYEYLEFTEDKYRVRADSLAAFVAAAGLQALYPAGSEFSDITVEFHSGRFYRLGFTMTPGGGAPEDGEADPAPAARVSAALTVRMQNYTFKLPSVQ